MCPLRPPSSTPTKRELAKTPRSAGRQGHETNEMDPSERNAEQSVDERPCENTADKFLLFRLDQVKMRRSSRLVPRVRKVQGYEASGFVKIPMFLARDPYLSPTEKVVYGVLMSHANRREPDGVPKSWPSRKTIGREAGIKPWAVSRATARLVKAGYIEIQPHHMHSNYYVLSAEITRREIEAYRDAQAERIKKGFPSDHDEPPLVNPHRWRPAPPTAVYRLGRPLDQAPGGSPTPRRSPDKPKPTLSTTSVAATDLIAEWERAKDLPFDSISPKAVLGRWCKRWKATQGTHYQFAKRDRLADLERRVAYLIHEFKIDAVLSCMEGFLKPGSLAGIKSPLKAFLSPHVFQNTRFRIESEKPRLQGNSRGRVVTGKDGKLVKHGGSLRSQWEFRRQQALSST